MSSDKLLNHSRAVLGFCKRTNICFQKKYLSDSGVCMRWIFVAFWLSRNCCAAFISSLSVTALPTFSSISLLGPQASFRRNLWATGQRALQQQRVILSKTANGRLHMRNSRTSEYTKSRKMAQTIGVFGCTGAGKSTVC